MASFIPSVYHPVDLGIGDIGNILLQARKQSRDDEARRAELLMRQEAADRENARLDEQMRHTSELENHQRQVDVANTLPKIKAMLTPGDPSYDPETGMSLARAYDINLSAKQPDAPTAPDKPTLQAQPVNPMFGPKMPQSMVDETDSPGRAAVENEKFYDYDRADANRAAQGQYAGQMADYQRQLAHPRAPTYSGTSPVGPISIDPNAAVAAREERLRQQQEQLAPLGGAVDEQFRPVVEAMVKAGMPPSEIAKTVGEYRKQMASDSRDAQYKPSVAKQDEWHQMMYRAAMANAGARRAQAGDDNPAIGAAIADYLERNPGDVAGAYRAAGAVGSVAPTKTVGAVVTQTKPTESQARSAEQAAQGLSAIDAIEKGGYRPSDADIQQWLNNQRSVALADKMGASGTFGALGAGAGQGLGVLKKSEFEGMSPEAASFFANYRRVMEPLARKQSGAAIGEGEWRNFFNQWGPNSPGGLAAARRDLENLARTGGAATRQLQSPRREPSQNERRADTLKNGGKGKSVADFEKEHGF